MNFLPPEIQRIYHAFRRHDFHSVRNEDLIHAALFFNRIFSREGATPLRAQVAAVCVALYYELNRRMSQASLTADALPNMRGVNWEQTSGLAGIVDDIPPFGSLDLWITSLAPNHPARRRPRPQRRQQTINMDEVNVQGRPPRPQNRGVPELRNQGAVEGISPIPADLGQLSDIAGWLDVGNGVAGVVAFVAESFILDVVGTLAGGVISMFGLAATWIDSDRQIARLHAAHTVCVTLWDMSFPFADPELFRRPYQNWPAIRAPIGPTLPTGTSNEAQIIRTAVETAHRQAYDRILHLEAHPETHIVRYDGREFRRPITGKAYLFLLNMAAQRQRQSVLHYLRDVMQRRTGLNLGMFRW